MGKDTVACRDSQILSISLLQLNSPDTKRSENGWKSSCFTAFMKAGPSFLCECSPVRQLILCYLKVSLWSISMAVCHCKQRGPSLQPSPPLLWLCMSIKTFVTASAAAPPPPRREARAKVTYVSRSVWVCLCECVCVCVCEMLVWLLGLNNQVDCAEEPGHQTFILTEI